MGKTRKVAKGHSARFVPDYRHAVETMNDLGRRGVDAEMGPSRKRRCVSLNGDSYDRFGVPVEVFPVSQMSSTGRKDLECRFKNELRQIRILQRRLAPVGSSDLPSPASDVHGLGGGFRKPALQNLNMPMNEATMLMGKKKQSQGRNRPRTKGAGASHPESGKPALPSSTPIVMLMKQCQTLLQRLMSHKNALIFNKPVDIVESNVPDYFTIIKQPMDLGTIKSKLLSGQYSDPLGFAADVRLTFSNAMTYNPRGNEVHVMAETLSKFFEERWKQIDKKLSMMVDSLLPLKQNSNIESETATSKSHIKNKKVGNIEYDVKQNYVNRVMTLEEKQKLTAELDEVSAELPETIIDFLKGNTNNSSESNDGELEIDLDSLTDETLFTLRDLLNYYLSNKQISEREEEPCEIELRNESGFSNSSVQPYRGNDLADEDVDIGGNDAPISSFPLLEIKKDGAGGNNKFSSSSSSSSDSGSSSSDISNGDVQPNSKGNFDSGSYTSCQEGGGNAPSERQVSPGKNYRAALLRSRFADTILKAQGKSLEKVVPQDEKFDLDRIRLQRQEFERKNKEDEARLLAEARAAEVAQRKLEAEAPAKAKRIRDLEREAARQALQKMEKAVDINQNTRFLEDLEILGSGPEQSLLGVTSPDDVQNVLGSFNLQASSNPLEQLGLYMKDDDDED